MKMVKILTK